MAVIGLESTLGAYEEELMHWVPGMHPVFYDLFSVVFFKEIDFSFASHVP